MVTAISATWAEFFELIHETEANTTHYTIRPVHDMPLTDYIELLEKLAQSTELVSGNTDTMARSAR